MDVPRNETQLRRWLNRELRKDVSEAVWQKLKDKYYVEEALIAPADDARRDSLLEWAGFLQFKERQAQRKQKRREVSGQVARSRFFPPPQDPVFKGSTVFSKHLGRMASRDGLVVRLRKRLLGDRTLNKREASILLKSAAPRFLRHHFFTSRGISLIENQSYFYDRKEKTRSNESWTPKTVLRIRWLDKTLDIRGAHKMKKKAEAHGIEFWSGSRPKIVAPGSVFDEIREASVTLAMRYGWDQTGATRFLLTGRSPLVPSIHYRVYRNPEDDYSLVRLELTVQPWVTAEMVRREFLAIQKDLYGSRRKQPNLTALQLFDFVEKRRPRDSKLTWEQLRMEWNEKVTPLGLRSFSDYRHFRQEYKRSRRSIAPSIMDEKSHRSDE